MATDKALIEKREELKRRLTAGEYKTLVDIFLEWFDRLIRKITRSAKSPQIWFIVVILYLVYYLTTVLVSYITQDRVTLEILLGQGAATSFGDRFAVYLTPAFFIIGMVVINLYIHKIFILWRDDLLDVTETVTSLEDFETWLEKACNWRLHLLVTLGGAVLGGIYMGSIASDSAGVFLGHSFVFGAIFLFVYFYAFVYLILTAILLSARLRRYDLILFAADPSSSEIISRLSDVLGSIVYFVAVLAAYSTLISALLGLLLPLGSVVVIVLWLPILAMFILNQTSLSSIIQRAKWKTLNEVQAKIEKIWLSKNFGGPKTMDAINKLMDYHDRVKATRDSALDFRAYLSFFNSLLLPLLAFILGNLDLVFSLFTSKP